MAVQTPFQRAVSIVGNQRKMAEKLKVSTAFVNHMVNGKKPVPATMCIAIENICQGMVTRYDLRPDVFGKAEAA